MFAGFARHRLDGDGVPIYVLTGGSGPPVLLLHGYPQTHAMWHRVAPRLAERFTVVVPDLRGYGDSGKPPGDPRHEMYSKRAMARDQVAVMRQLGHERFAVAGHDRGGRVAYRLALDHPERVTRLAVLDIAPTLTVFDHVDRHVATSTFHWFFLIQPYDFPERLIGGDPAYYLRHLLGRWSGDGLKPFASEALAEYVRCFADPASIHATCEDYRAGASVDYDADAADYGHRRIGCPVLALWGGTQAARRGDLLAVSRQWADDVRGGPLPCGHFLAEEEPEATADALHAFFAEERGRDGRSWRD
jgi:haloacetate dehalogenase